MAHRFPMGIMGPDGLYRGLASEAKILAHRALCCPEMGQVVFSTQWPLGEEPLTGSSGAQSHYAPFAVVGLQPCLR